MLVSELIHELEKLDGDLLVVRAGYDSGVEELKTVILTTIALNANPDTQWWRGPHEVIDSSYNVDNSYQDLTQLKQVQAVFIG